MAAAIPGYTTEQKVVTVANNDSAINTEITAQGADQWMAASLVLSGSDMVILFTRTIANPIT